MDQKTKKVKLLPLNCLVWYSPDFLDLMESQTIFNYIINNFPLQRRTVQISDRPQSKLKRSTLIFTDQKIIDQKIIPKMWGIDTPMIIWPQIITNIKNKIENLTGKVYNICLCNFYSHGKQCVGWHSDQEEYGSRSSIVSISLGCERKFLFREIENNGNIYEIRLESGSLLIMGENCQERYEPCVPVDKNIKQARINLTFRLFDADRYLLPNSNKN
jgi:alkylated DNA repair dioxygenase AlkB